VDQAGKFLDNKMMKIFSTIILIFITSCSVPNWYKPSGYRMFSQLPKGGTPGFNLGWYHGCESGLGTQFGGAIYEAFYAWKRDPDITSANPDIPKIRARYKKELKNVNWNNPAEVKKNFSDYNTIFWGAHYFCRQSVLGTLQSASMSAPMPGEDRYKPTAHSVTSIWRLNGRGDVRIGGGDAPQRSLW